MTTSAQSSLAERYGTTKRRRVDRWIGWSLAAAMVLGGIAFLVFGGMPTQSSSIEFRDISYNISEDEMRASVTFEVTGPANRELVCGVEALNKTYAVVGFAYVEFEPSPERTRVVTQEVRTANEPTTVTVKDCWAQPES